jgi:hypothetical protein
MRRAVRSLTLVMLKLFRERRCCVKEERKKHMRREVLLCVLAGILAIGHAPVVAQVDREVPIGGGAAVPVDSSALNAWGLDVLISNDGFGLGGFYRREFSPDLFGFVSLSIAESKDSREMERIDPFTQVSFVPGKLNRFMVVPLMVGVQRRLFREDITDNFRPYVNAGIGPTLIYSSPFTEFVETPLGLAVRQVEFFKSFGKGQPHYTASGFIGAGANFGTDTRNLFGLNFRYYFTYLFGEGLPSLYDTSEGNFGQVAARKNDFGGFFITLNMGLVY